MNRVHASVLAPVIFVAACATASVGEDADGGSKTTGTTAQNQDDAASTSYGGDTSDSGSSETSDASSSDAAIAIEAGIPIPRAGLVGEWLFTDNLNDTSGNAFDGVATGATFGPDRFGVANGAAVFNGINQYISVPSESDLALTGDLTISAWINPVAITQLAGIELCDLHVSSRLQRRHRSRFEYGVELGAESDHCRNMDACRRRDERNHRDDLHQRRFHVHARARLHAASSQQHVALRCRLSSELLRRQHRRHSYLHAGAFGFRNQRARSRKMKSLKVLIS
jgi:hypothetical protein